MGLSASPEQTSPEPSSFRFLRSLVPWGRIYVDNHAAKRPISRASGDPLYLGFYLLPSVDHTRHPLSVIPWQIANLLSVFPKHGNRVFLVWILGLSYQNHPIAFPAVPYRVLVMRFTHDAQRIGTHFDAVLAGATATLGDGKPDHGVGQDEVDEGQDK